MYWVPHGNVLSKTRKMN